MDDAKAQAGRSSASRRPLPAFHWCSLSRPEFPPWAVSTSASPVLSTRWPKRVFTGVKESHPRMAIQMETGRSQRDKGSPAGLHLLAFSVPSTRSVLPSSSLMLGVLPGKSLTGWAAVTLPSPGSEPCPRAPPMGRRQPSGLSKPSCLLDERHLGPASPSSTQAETQYADNDLIFIQRLLPDASQQSLQAVPADGTMYSRSSPGPPARPQPPAPLHPCVPKASRAFFIHLRDGESSWLEGPPLPYPLRAPALRGDDLCS